MYTLRDILIIENSNSRSLDRGLPREIERYSKRFCERLLDDTWFTKTQGFLRTQPKEREATERVFGKDWETKNVRYRLNFEGSLWVCVSGGTGGVNKHGKY